MGRRDPLPLRPGDVARVRLPGLLRLFRVPPEHRVLLGRVGLVSLVEQNGGGRPYTVVFDDHGDILVEQFDRHELAPVAEHDRRFGA